MNFMKKKDRILLFPIEGKFLEEENILRQYLLESYDLIQDELAKDLTVTCDISRLDKFPMRNFALLLSFIMLVNSKCKKVIVSYPKEIIEITGIDP